MIRLADKHDKENWIKLNYEFIDYEYEDENVWQDPKARGDIGEIFDCLMDESQTSNMTLMVDISLENEIKSIGFMNIVCFYSVWAHGMVWFLDDFFITEEYRSRGLGSMAMKQLENMARQEGIIRIQLFSEKTNPRALAFYRKLGYDSQYIDFNCKYL